MRALIVMPRARRQLRAAERWWESHREKAPDAFSEDIAAGLNAIAENPSIYPQYDSRRGIRRILMERIRYHLYYRVNASGNIEVLSVWHASRRPPRL